MVDTRQDPGDAGAAGAGGVFKEGWGVCGVVTAGRWPGSDPSEVPAGGRERAERPCAQAEGQMHRQGGMRVKTGPARRWPWRTSSGQAASVIAQSPAQVMSASA